MKEIETIVTEYMANDGTRFVDKESCEKHEAECLKREKECTDRIAMIKAKRKSIDEANAEFERKQELLYVELYEKISSLKSRIDMVVRVARELCDEGFALDKFKYVYPYMSFGLNCNRTISFVGLYFDMHSYSCGRVRFDTDGFNKHYNINGLKIQDKITICEIFLERFDEFESEFYKWVDDLCKVENTK